jgi:hypothetical protein
VLTKAFGPIRTIVPADRSGSISFDLNRHDLRPINAILTQKLNLSSHARDFKLFSASDACADPVFEALLMFRAKTIAAARKFIGPDSAPAFKYKRDFLLIPALDLFRCVCFTGIFLILDFSAGWTPLVASA